MDNLQTPQQQNKAGGIEDEFVWQSPMLKSAFSEGALLPPQLDLSSAQHANGDNKNINDGSSSSSSNSSSNSSSSLDTDDVDADEDEFAGERDRFQLFLNEANSYSHVVSLALALKGLENVVYPNILRHENGDHLENEACAGCNISIVKFRICEFARTMSTLFKQPRFPVPLLYDTKQHEIVSTETDVIIRFLNMEFNEFALNPDLDICSVDDSPVWSGDIKTINECIGRAGKASSSEEFAEASNALHEALRHLDGHLSDKEFICGDYLSEADLYEFVPLFRYDPLYSWVMTVNGQRYTVQEHYPNIFSWLSRIYRMDGVSATCDLVEILNSISFYKTFGVRLRELGVAFDEDWEVDYLSALAGDDFELDGDASMDAPSITSLSSSSFSPSSKRSFSNSSDSSSNKRLKSEQR